MCIRPSICERHTDAAEISSQRLVLASRREALWPGARARPTAATLVARHGHLALSRLSERGPAREDGMMIAVLLMIGCILLLDWLVEIER